MHTPLQIPPKRIGRTLATTSVPGLPTSRLLHIHDPTNHLTFLIDTGAAVSVLPPTATDRKFPQPHFHLVAANGSKIFTFGRCSLTLNLGLRRSLPWVFMVAEVQTPIIGSIRSRLPPSFQLVSGPEQENPGGQHH